MTEQEIVIESAHIPHIAEGIDSYAEAGILTVKVGAEYR